MSVKAILFDAGGVLEIVDDPVWVRDWTDVDLAEVGAWTGVDPLAVTLGHVDESTIRAGYQDALGLSEAQADQFMAQMWDWYCGVLDERLFEWAVSLAGARVGILSNSADGARREEERRYAFSTVFDPVLYSHEIHLAKPDPAVFAETCERLGCAPAEILLIDDLAPNVDAARAYGLKALLHRSTPDTIAAADSILQTS